MKRRVETCVLVKPDRAGDPYARFLEGIPDLVPPRRRRKDAMDGVVSIDTMLAVAGEEVPSMDHPFLQIIWGDLRGEGYSEEDAWSLAFGEFDVFVGQRGLSVLRLLIEGIQDDGPLVARVQAVKYPEDLK